MELSSNFASFKGRANPRDACLGACEGGWRFLLVGPLACPSRLSFSLSFSCLSSQRALLLLDYRAEAGWTPATNLMRSDGGAPTAGMR